MAWNFVAASSERYYVTGFNNVEPFTVHAWFRCADNTADNGSIASIGSSTSGNFDGWDLWAYSDGVVYFELADADSGAEGGVNQAYSSNTWHSLVGLVTSATSYNIWIDGSGPATGTSDVGNLTPANPEFSIGSRTKATPNIFFSGDIAQVAVWNVGLGAGERAALDLGVAPTLIRPDALVHCNYLLRTIDAPFVTAALSTDGTPTYVEHPRLILPAQGFSGRPVSVSSVSTHHLHLPLLGVG